MEKLNFKIEKIILMVITSILILTAFEVKAEELQGVYSSATYNYRLLEFANVPSESVTKPMGELVNSVPTNAYLDRYIMRVYSDTTSFKTGNTYSFNFYSTLNLDTETIIGDKSSANYLRRCYDVSVYANTTSTSQESTTDLVKSKEVIISQDPNSSVRIYVKLIASFHQDVKFVSVLFKHKDICNVYYAGSTTPVVPLKAIGLRTLNITYQQGTDSILNDQNQILQDGFGNIEDSLTDSSIDNSSIGSAFNDLQNNYVSPSSMGSFSGFLTLPLSWVQTLLSGGTCSDIRLPLPFLENKYIVLPCLDTFWNSLGLLATIVELCWLAVVGTRVFNGLFTIVVDVKDPNNSQSMDLLKSWEL